MIILYVYFRLYSFFIEEQIKKITNFFISYKDT